LLGALLDALLRRPYFWSALLLLFAVSVVARVLFVGQHLTPADALGLACADHNRSTSPPWPAALGESTIFLLACLAVLMSSMWPSPEATESATAARFVWLPFAELAGGTVDPDTLPLLERLFLGIGLAWLALH